MPQPTTARCYDEHVKNNESDVIEVQDLLASSDVIMDEDDKQSGYRFFNKVSDGDVTVELQFEEDLQDPCFDLISLAAHEPPD